MRLRLSPAAWLLLAGDLVMFWLFVYYGKMIHHMPISLIAILETLAPFLVGWVVAALLFRSYRKQVYENGWRLLLSTLLTWTVAAPIGIVLRSWWLDAPITWIFTQVTYGVTLAFLLGWRVPFAVVYTVRERVLRKSLR
ncbi:DUF3054 domain-containing protein [Brevibacillus sp. TJ4]|uniref:DUF3054 domain-containing protein n=1 Tax=Brevibacillus sp. TJ4 TaxID=3234853 RepID=UPI003B9E69CE